MKKIVIINENAYCGGSLVLSTLCSTLREIGYDARVFVIPDWDLFSKRKGWKKFKWYIYITLNSLRWLLRDILHSFFPRWSRISIYYKSGKTSIVEKTKKKYIPVFGKNTIVIYPEIIYGNPLYAKQVARWFLYFDRYSDFPDAYGDDDFFFSYAPNINPIDKNPQCYIVHINYFNSRLYHQFNYDERSGCCYVFWKGWNRNDIPTTLDGPLCDKLSEEEKVECFNKYKYCYIYDPYSFYATVAAVCGCIPVIVLEPGKTETDYIDNEHPEHYGIAYGDSENQIKYAIETRNLLLNSLDFSEKNKQNAQYLVEILQNRFGKIKRIHK